MKYAVEISEGDAKSIVACVLDPQVAQRLDAAARRAILDAMKPKEESPPEFVVQVPIVHKEAQIPHGPDAATKALEAFCAINELVPPAVVWKEGRYPQIGTMTASYSRDLQVITVYVDHAVKPVIVTEERVCEARDVQLRKTWPCWLEDYTVLGAVCHELGHHVQLLKGWKRVDRTYYDPYIKETPVSMYSRSSRPEDFAECFRLFLTNPKLLLALCPMRYAYFTKSLKLQPIETRDWDDLLSDSPQRVEFIRSKLGK